jgi:hypothetical protein
MLKGHDRVSVMTSQYLIQDTIDGLLHIKLLTDAVSVSRIISIMNQGHRSLNMNIPDCKLGLA